MKAKPLVVLGVENLVLSDPFPAFWEIVSSATGTDTQIIINKYQKEVEEDLIRGKITEKDFWNWLEESFQTTHLADIETWRQSLLARIYPLPVTHIIPRLALFTDVVFICNGVRSIFYSFLFSESLTKDATKTYFSSETGYIKPEIAAFEKIKADLPEKRPSLYVDYNSYYLQEVKSNQLFSTLVSDSQSMWIKTMFEWAQTKSDTSLKRGLYLPA